MEEEKDLSRRNFLSVATWTLGGVIGLGVMIPSVAYIIGPASQKTGTEEWIRLGSASKVEIGTPTLFKVKVEQKTGWIVSEEELSFYVMTDNGRDYVAMSNICTHLGCRVRWISEQEQFFCPCHNAVFDKEGNVESGPPPRPLDKYEVKVDGNQLYVLVG